MQVKKFEAPTIQEALDTIKRELGPEAIILQTKKHKKGFGLLSKPSVEVTAAVSERSLQKKKVVESKLPDPNRTTLNKMSAGRQAEIFDKYADKHLQRAGATKDKVELSSRGATAAGRPQPAPQRAPATRATAAMQASAAQTENTQTAKITATRYIDIPEDAHEVKKAAIALPAAKGEAEVARNQQVNSPLGSNAPAPKGQVGRMTMEEELSHLKRMIEEMKTTQDDGLVGSGAQVLMTQTSLSTPALQDAFEQLVVNGLDKRFALALAKRAAFEMGQRSEDPDQVADQLALELMQSTEVLSALSGIEAGTRRGSPVTIAMVGPTGVGKTTTVAKIASEALLKRNLKVGLINLDSYKVAAFDQLATYAKILNVPFRSVATGEDLKVALQDFQNLDLVLIDTTGRSQKDPGSLKQMQDIFAVCPEMRTHLVLAATTRDTELYDQANRFAMFRPQGLTISKLDEATTYGAIYNVSQKVKLPLLYFTTGQRVPEDIEEASKERVAALILNI